MLAYGHDGTTLYRPPSHTTLGQYVTEANGMIVITTDGTTLTVECSKSPGCGP